MGSGHFAPFCAVACCKKSKYSLLSSDLLLLSLTTVFFLLFFQIALDPIGCFCEECKCQRQGLYTNQGDENKYLNIPTKTG